MNAKDKAKQKEYRSKLNALDLEARDKQNELINKYGENDKTKLDDELKALHVDISKRKTALHATYYGSEPQSSEHWFYK